MPSAHTRKTVKRLRDVAAVEAHPAGIATPIIQSFHP